LNYKALFEPQTMAVVGISLTNDSHPGNVIYYKNYLRYPVKTYGVNPRGGVHKEERIFSCIGDIPEKIDLAVIAVRAELVPGVMKECIEAEVGGAVVISGGFAETGNRELQDRLAAIAREADFPFIGPNCLGIFSRHVDTFFLPSERLVRPDPGRVAIVSQSGGILVDQMVKFSGQGIGLSCAVGIGNKALIREIDLLDYFSRDEETSVIAFYIEGFNRNEGREFVQAASLCSKPVIVMKSGKTSEGTRAAVSHTASIAGDYSVTASVLGQFGIAEAKNEFELVSFCESLSCYPTSIGNSIGIVTGSGGHGVVAVDACLAAGFTVPQLPNGIQDAIRAKLSPSIQPIAALGNPIDLTGSAMDDDFVLVASELSEMQEIDCVLMLLLPYLPEVTSDVGARLSQVYRKKGKPLIAYVPHVEKYRMLIEGFQLNQVPVSHSIEGAVLMAEAMRRRRPC
jgi:acyl-CoA synthetase (NDP forming)